MTTHRGPDIVIAGAARSGTSLLAAHLGEHPRIDPGKVKETNFYSRHFEDGYEWYEQYFVDDDSLFRLDASVSYTYPHFPQSLERVAADDPSVVVYVVREPIRRAVSHYLLYRYYFEHEKAPTFGAALAANPFYADTSDYDRWLTELDERFGDRLLIVPFDLLTDSTDEVAAVICARLGLDAPPPIGEQVKSHQNNVVAFRSDIARRVTGVLRQSRWYPRVRDTLGSHVMRRIRKLATKVPEMPSTQEALDTCDAASRAHLDDVAARSNAAVTERLRAQDERLGMSWSQRWTTNEPTGA